MSGLIALIRGKIFCLKLRLFNKNVTIDNGLKLYCRLSIAGKGRVSIGKNCTVKGLPGSRTQYVTLYTTSPEAELRIGDNVQLIAAKTSCNYSLCIGNNVIIEDSSLLDSDFHALDNHSEGPSNESKESCAIVIGNNITIGARSIITKGVQLDEGSRVAPCSVVQRSFPKGSVIFGNPARLLEK